MLTKHKFLSWLLVLSFTVLANVNLDWKMQAEKGENGATVSGSSFDDKNWYTATVPGTVLKTLVDNKVYSMTNNDPFYGKNMWIGKITDIGATKAKYWYRGKLKITKEEGIRYWLHLDGINYKADIFVNGKSTGNLVGAFIRGKFDITSNVVDGDNYVAILIYPNNFPGTYMELGNKIVGTGGCTANGRASDNADVGRDGPTFMASQSWDWIPTIADRNIGVWNEVYVRTTRSVVIRDPFIKTFIPNLTTFASADVSLSVKTKSATGSEVKGKLKVEFSYDNKTVFTEEKDVTAGATGEGTETSFTTKIDNPKIWWPNGLGDPNLYTCKITFSDGSVISDTSTFRFGIRDLGIRASGTSLSNVFSRDKTKGGFTIRINGVEVLARGGNWGMDDAMKITDHHKMRMKIRYHREMNFNMIRNWVGQTDDDVFFEACDEYGIMVWDDFWMAHEADQPKIDNESVFLENAKDKVLRYRNHPSLVVRCGRNETQPFPNLDRGLKSLIVTLDGTRDYQSYSADENAGGVKSGGPYDWQTPESYYSNSRVFGGSFHTEIGSQAVPTYESVSKFVDVSKSWPNEEWAFHDWCDLNANPDRFKAGLDNRYGATTDLKTFCKRSQLLNIETFKAIFEALNLVMFKKCSGLLLWMSNPSWPNFVWQTYDYYMEPIGAYWGCKIACQPIHVQYAATNETRKIMVVNTTAKPVSNLKVDYVVYNLDGTKRGEKTIDVASVGSNGTFDCGALSVGGVSTTYFLSLKLKDSNGGLISKNFYWLSTNTSSPDFKSMNTMGKATVELVNTATWTKKGSTNFIKFSVKNPSNVVSVANQLKLQKKSNGERVLPVIYSDSYFSLVPGESQEITIEFDDVDLGNDKAKLLIEGYNSDVIEIALPDPVSVRPALLRQKANYSVALQGNTLNITNVKLNDNWNIRIVNIAGRTVLDKSGIAKNTAQISIPTQKFRSGAYIAQIDVAGEKNQMLFTIKK
jgi:beta-mannosidase